MENPEILWAQNREKIFITINADNIIEQNIEMEADLVNFQGKNSSKQYNVEIRLLKTIEPEESTWTIKPNCVTFTLKKQPEVFWSKLTTMRFNNIRVDWNKWDVMEDSDEESDDMTFEQQNLFSNFKDFTKTLPSDLMEKDFQELFPQDLNEELTDDETEINYDAGESSDTSFNVENLNIEKLNEEIILKMEEGRITRKDRESLSTNDEEEEMDKVSSDIVNNVMNDVISENEKV